MRNTLLSALALLSLSYAGRVEAETITGRFTYQDFIPQQTEPPTPDDIKPISFAKVEIWHKGPGWWELFGIAATTTTDENGNIPALNINRGAGVYFARVFALNPAADVFSMGGLATFFQDSTLITSTGLSATINLSKHTAGIEDAGMFNVAQMILQGFNYANDHRAPGETDVLGRVLVRPHYTAFAYAYYDRAAILLSNYAIFQDFMILHEYGHFLQEKIGTFAALPADHDGCSINSGSNITNDLLWKWIAWQEGFADYFARRVISTIPFINGVFQRVQGTSASYESPAPCSFPGNTVENFVAAGLLDLADPIGGGPSEAFDIFANHEDEVFHIFDDDLDLDFGANPTIEDFIDAWISRGNDYPALFTMFTSIGLVPPTLPAVSAYHLDGRGARAIWRPGAASVFHIKKNDTNNDANVITWGTTGDIPVPADYDADDISDIAIYRPSTGEWWVQKSGSGGAWDIERWGFPCSPSDIQANCDVPAPGDFDGDGDTEYAIYRPATSEFWVHGDTANEQRNVYTWEYHAKPAVADFDGDGRDDFGVFLSGVFTVVNSATPTRNEVPFGVDGIPVPGDYQGDARAELAVFNPSTYQYLVKSTTTGVISTVFTGAAGDKPVPADYNGDQKIDAAIWRPSDANWWVKQSANCGGVMGTCGAWNVQTWGAAGDIPVPGRL